MHHSIAASTRVRAGGVACLAGPLNTALLLVAIMAAAAITALLAGDATARQAAYARLAALADRGRQSAAPGGAGAPQPVERTSSSSRHQENDDTLLAELSALKLSALRRSGRSPRAALHP